MEEEKQEKRVIHEFEKDGVLEKRLLTFVVVAVIIIGLAAWLL